LKWHCHYNYTSNSTVAKFKAKWYDTGKAKNDDPLLLESTIMHNQWLKVALQDKDIGSYSFLVYIELAEYSK